MIAQPSSNNDDLSSSKLPAAGALTVYPLQPVITATIDTDSRIHLAIRSLKPGFTRAIERTSEPSQLNSWREVGRLEGSDFLFDWSEQVSVSPAFYRFRQP